MQDNVCQIESPLTFFYPPTFEDAPAVLVPPPPFDSIRVWLRRRWISPSVVGRKLIKYLCTLCDGAVVAYARCLSWYFVLLCQPDCMLSIPSRAINPYSSWRYHAAIIMSVSNSEHGGASSSSSMKRKQDHSAGSPEGVPRPNAKAPKRASTRIHIPEHHASMSFS